MARPYGGLGLNRCGDCGKFRSWRDLIPHFVPDTAFSSEDESWFECRGCRKERKRRKNANADAAAAR